MSRATEYAEVWSAALPYMRARKNDVHIPIAYRFADVLSDRIADSFSDSVTDSVPKSSW